MLQNARSLKVHTGHQYPAVCIFRPTKPARSQSARHYNMQAMSGDNFVWLCYLIYTRTGSLCCEAFWACFVLCASRYSKSNHLRHVLADTVL